MKLNSKTIEQQEAFEQLILNAPIMTDEQYQQFKNNRKYFDTWRKIEPKQ